MPPCPTREPRLLDSEVAVATIAPLLTYDDLANLPDAGKRYELLEGELVVRPAPLRRHQRAIWALTLLLSRAQNAGLGEVFIAPFDVVFDRHTVTEPDALFVRRERLHSITVANVQDAPDLVVEVLSPGTGHRDPRAKRQIYAKCKVPYYWSVDPGAGTVQVHVLIGEGYQPEPLLAGGAELGCPLFPGITIEVSRLFT